MVVDGGVGAAPGRAGEGHGRDARPERRTSSSGLAPRKAASGVPQQKQKQDGELLAQGAEERRGVVGGRRARRPPRGRARPCASRPPRSARSPRRPIASKSPGGRALRISACEVGCGSSSGRRPSRRPASRASSRAAAAAGVVARRTQRVDGQEGARRRCGRARAPAGSAAPAGSEDHWRRAGAVGVEGEAAGPDRPGAGGQAGRARSTQRVAADAAGTRRRRRRSAPAPREVASWATPSAARAKLAVGLLPAEPAVRRRGGRRRRRRRGRPRSTGDGDADRVRAPARSAARRSELAQAVRGGLVSRCRERSRSRPCGPSRSGRAGGSSARRPRSCRPSR